MKQLTLAQRYSIQTLLAKNFSFTEIAESVNVHKSTISREIKRNGLKASQYNATKADKRARRRTRRTPYKLTPVIWEFCKERLKEKDSPEQISVHVKRTYSVSISHEWVYQQIYRAVIDGEPLHKHLRQKRKRRRKRGSKTDGRGSIPNRIMITERPSIINEKKEYGHWEADTIVGKDHKSFLLTLVERVSKFTYIHKLQDSGKITTMKAIVDIIRQSPYRFQSIMCDNGREFTEHQAITEQTNTIIYFAEPYSPWQRGLNENTNGLIRQFIPKSTDINLFSDDEIEAIQNNLNHRIRKTLTFEKPVDRANKYVALKC